MQTEQNPALDSTTLWVGKNEYGTDKYNETVGKLKAKATSRNKPVIFISGKDSLSARTGALLKSQLTQGKGA